MKSTKNNNKSTKVNPDLLKVIIAVLSLKNLELNRQGYKIGNKPDLIWYEKQIRNIGLSVSLLQLHHNLKRLSRAGIFDFKSEDIEYGIKGKRNIFNRYTPSYYQPSTLIEKLWEGIRFEIFGEKRYRNTSGLMIRIYYKFNLIVQNLLRYHRR